MTPEERQAALQLVDEIQAERSGKRLDGIPAREVPYILLPYQVRWHRDASVVRLCEKGRRVGFTWGAWAAEAALEAARASGGMDQFYMGYNQGMAAEFIGDVATFARWYNLVCAEIDVRLEGVVIDDEKRDIVTYKIKFASGHKVEALSAMPHNWRGRQGHARIDEAGHHTRLQAVIDGALAYRIWGGRISIGGTHRGEDSDFNDYVRRCKDGKLGWSLHRVTFSDAVGEGLYKRICLVTKKDWSTEAERTFVADVRDQYPESESANEELECIPKRGSGAYFSRLLVEHCGRPVPILRYRQSAEFVTDANRIAVTQRWIDEMLQPVLAALPPDRRTVVGQDFGRSGDLSVMWPLQAAAIGRGWETPFLVELRNIPFDCQQLILFAVLDGLPLMHHIKLDARGNGQSHAEAALQRYGATRVECVQTSGTWYDEWFPKYHQAFEDGEISVPSHEDVIADHRAVVLLDGKPRMSAGRTKGSDGGDRHGDSAVAGVMAWAAAHSDAQPSAGASVTARPGDYRAERGSTTPGRAMFGSRADRLSRPRSDLFGRAAATTAPSPSTPVHEKT